MHVQIDETWTHDQARNVDNGRTVRRTDGTHGRHHAIAQQHVRHTIEAP
jgi:hypothetical protein